MNKEYMQMLLTILLQLKADVIKLNKGELPGHYLNYVEGICKYLYREHVVNAISYDTFLAIKQIFRVICWNWPECRRSDDEDKSVANCVVSYEVYHYEFINQIQWTNLRRLELLEFSIKYLEDKLNEPN